MSKYPSIINQLHTDHASDYLYRGMAVETYPHLLEALTNPESFPINIANFYKDKIKTLSETQKWDVLKNEVKKEVQEFLQNSRYKRSKIIRNGLNDTEKNTQHSKWIYTFGHNENNNPFHLAGNYAHAYAFHQKVHENKEPISLIFTIENKNKIDINGDWHKKDEKVVPIFIENQNIKKVQISYEISDPKQKTFPSQMSFHSKIIEIIRKTQSSFQIQEYKAQRTIFLGKKSQNAFQKTQIIGEITNQKGKLLIKTDKLEIQTLLQKL